MHPCILASADWFGFLVTEQPKWFRGHLPGLAKRENDLPKMNNDSEDNSAAEPDQNDGVAIEFPGVDTQIRGILFEGGSTSAPGVVLIPDVHGISLLYKELGASLANAGLRTLVLDMYTREGNPQLGDMPSVFEWIANLPDARILGDIDAALDHLGSTGSSNVGVVGFCLGGQYSIMTACRNTEVAAAVSFYGMLATAEKTTNRPAAPLDMIDDLRCPLLGLYGSEDALVPGEDLDQLATACKDGGHRLSLHRYSGAGHAFLNRFRPEAYREQAARDAWQRALDFLTAELG
jgi:carboxymethylenebutenolidase